MGMLEAIGHLIETHGRRRIVFLRGPAGFIGSQHRYQAYLDALEHHQIAFDPNLVTAVATSWGYTEALGVFASFLEDHALRPRYDFDAVVGANDEMALAAVNVLQKRGLRIPDDISVAGFDDLALSGSASPALTTVRPPFAQMGMRAVELILGLLDENAQCSALALPQILPTQVVIRHSCGCQLPTIAEASVKEPEKIFQPDPGLVISKSTLGAYSSEKTGLAASLVDRRKELVQAMAQAASGLPEAVRLAGQILNGFIREIDSGAPEAFLSSLDEAFNQVIAQGGRVKEWQTALSVMRQHTLPYLKKPGVRQKADDLWHQGRVMIAEHSWRNQSWKRLKVEERSRQLRTLGARLATMLTFEGIQDVLAQELPNLGISRSYLMLNEAALPGRVRMALGYDQNGRLFLPEDEACITCQELLPKAVWEQPDRFSLLVEALYLSDESLGFIVFETAGSEGGRESDIYDALKMQISSAIKAARLHQEASAARLEAETGWKLADERRIQAEEADRLKSRFLSMVSHELRTPLNVISGLTENLLEDIPRVLDAHDSRLDSSLRDLERIQGSAQHLDNLIRDVLDLAVSQVGQLRLNYEQIAVHETLASVFEIGEKLASARGIGWRLELAQNLPPIFWDRTRLRQVALNLVTNAVKFTENGEVVFSTTEKAHAEGRFIELSVRDTGLGIPQEEQELVFEEFQRSERATTRGYGGLGLGLAVCKKLVELGGGKIWVESSGEVGGGSIFTFILPVQGEKMPGHLPKGWEIAHPERINILVVDDELIFLELHVRMLEAQFPGVTVQRARSGREALQVMVETSPGLVLLDLMMPEMDGYQVLKEMRESVTLRRIPVIVLTAQNLSEDEMSNLNQGVAAVLQKGVFGPQEILSQVAAVLGHSKQLGSEARRIARRAMAYMHEHYREEITRKLIADHVGVSQEYLSTCFRRESGLTPTVYLERYRIKQAKKLLETTDLSITEVAQEVGIPDSSYFGRIFRRETGITPAAFRKGERVS